MPAKFSDEFRGADWLDGIVSPALHARFIGKNSNSVMGEWETLGVVTAFEQGAIFEWSVFDAAGNFSDIPVAQQEPMASWRFEIQDQGDVCRVIYTATLGAGNSGLSRILDLRPDERTEIMARRMKAWLFNMEETLAGVRLLAIT